MGAGVVDSSGWGRASDRGGRGGRGARRRSACCCRVPTVGQDVLQAGDLTDEHIVKAIDVLVDELYRQQRKNRFWDPTTPELKADGGGWKMMDPQKPGWTALAVLALLHAGESYQEPRLRSAIRHLQNVEMLGTYALATRALVWAMLPDQFHGELQADAESLMKGFIVDYQALEQLGPPDFPTTGRKVLVRGGWHYACVHGPWMLVDNSNTQFAALALWMADRRDVKIDQRIRKILEEHVIATQLPDGGWRYREVLQPRVSPTGSRRAAGCSAGSTKSSR